MEQEVQYIANRNTLRDTLKHHVAYNEISDENIENIIDNGRIINLRKNEVFHLQCSGNFGHLVILQGKLEVQNESKQVTALDFNNELVEPFLLSSSGVCQITAIENCIISHVELCKSISLDADNTIPVVEKKSLFWKMNTLRNCHTFRGLPLTCAEQAIHEMDEIVVSKGEEIITVGEDVEKFYIITSGSAEVWRPCIYQSTMQLTETLNVGACMGNEALIMGKQANKTIRMNQDGILLAMDKEDFHALIQTKLVKSVNANIAKSMIDSGYKILDVRYEEEYEMLSIPNATLIPLHELNARMDELDDSQNYIAYCHSGNRSQVAAMKMRQENIEVWSLEGGIRDWPFDIQEDIAS